MIVDTHVYVFRAPDEPAGHASGAEHLGYWQWGYALHHQPAIRTRDHATVPGRRSRAARPDARRSDATARRTATSAPTTSTAGSSGRSTARTTRSSTCRRTCSRSRPGMLIAEMDYAGVDWALNHVDMALDKGNDYFAEAVRAYPDRIVSMAQVDEWRIGDRARRRRSARSPTRSASRASTRSRSSPSTPTGSPAPKGFDEPSWRPFWDAVTQLGVPIFFTLGATPGIDGRAGRVHQRAEHAQAALGALPGH